jgi:hypothetical protein
MAVDTRCPGAATTDMPMTSATTNAFCRTLIPLSLRMFWAVSANETFAGPADTHRARADACTTV